MEFIKPKFGVHDKPAGVYKITFDDKWFYVGSSVNLKNRFRTWEFKLLNNCFKSKNIRHILPTVSVIKFEVLELLSDFSLLRKNETDIIAKHWHNDLLLNRCPDATKTKGLSPDYLGKVEKVKPPLKHGTPAKKVAVFNLQDQLIEVCKSYAECTRLFKIDNDEIGKILAGKRGQPLRLMYRLKIVNQDGSFSEPPAYVPKITLPAHSKKIHQFDKEGNFIKEHPSINTAVREIAGRKLMCNPIQKILAGVKNHKSWRGFTFKYA